MKAENLSTFIISVCSFLVEGLSQSFSEKNNRISYDARIINGEPANPANFLYAVVLKFGGDAVCGGSIVHEYFILTAADCISDDRCTGMHIYPSTYTGERMAGIETSHCYRHENFRPVDFSHDIGLIYTVKNLVYDLGLEVIPLPEQGTSYPDGTPAVIVGWGKVQQPYYPNKIYSGSVVVENWDSCNYQYQHAESCIGAGICPAVEIPSTNGCVTGSSVDMPQSACEGDLGGPVVVNGVLAGVMCGAIRTEYECVEGSPTMFVMVPLYVSWIRDIIGPLLAQRAG